MTKYLFLLKVWLAFNGCVNDNTTQSKKNANQDLNRAVNQLEDTIYIKKWLTKAITDYVNSEDPKLAQKNLQEVLSVDYYNYKIEAITLEYSDMTDEEFHNKWKSKYDTELVGNGGFFTSVGDNGNVEISQCRLLKIYGDTAKIFQTVVHDIYWNNYYKLDIKIISKDNKLLIDDVQEQKYGR